MGYTLTTLVENATVPQVIFQTKNYVRKTYL